MRADGNENFKIVILNITFGNLAIFKKIEIRTYMIFSLFISFLKDELKLKLS